MNGEKMIKEKKGKAVNIIHYVGDQLWNFSAKSL
jgi:predicted ribosome-associated RNA-binding protein Tma20